MKSLSLLAALVSVLGMAAAAQAGFVGPSNSEKATVAQAKEMADDTYVVLQGTIESSLGDEKYLFKDATGTIRVEIDDEDWQGLTVTPKDKVEIKGEVDTHLTKPADIDVDSITLVK